MSKEHPDTSHSSRAASDLNKRTPDTGVAPTVVPGSEGQLDSDLNLGLAAANDSTRAHEVVADGKAGLLLASRYTLLQQIGEGGMGEVWMAQQSEPVKRRVAIKLIKAGMDSRAVLARFEAERQALAIMDHTNIARILDGGTTPQGRPFFVMEMVKGVPLTEYCDQTQQTVRQRLELFSQVCSAVQHAHQKGIIHRDLKPTNILVTEIDGRPVCKVIDFGLAKALYGASALSDISLHTAFGAVLGTPLYMAPEQLGINALDIDTRADVYSLGVILYELLTGSTPIERQRLKKAAWEEVRRMVREEDPIVPSARLSSSETLPAVAASRHVEPAQLTSLVRGELDWIIMKTLEKDRNRRYETANELALDIQRFFSHEAVSAAPPSRFYRLRKHVQRNQGAVISGSAIFLSLVGGIIGTSIGQIRANQFAKAEQRERTNAQSKQLEAERQQARAEAREQQAIQAVRQFSEAISNNLELKNDPNLESLRQALLKEPLAFFGSLREQLQTDKSTKIESLGHLAFAANEHARLTKEIGDQQQAVRAFEEARSLVNGIANNHPDVPKFQSELASILGNLGTLLQELGHGPEGMAACQEALAIRQRLANNESSAENKHHLARAHINLGSVAIDSGDMQLAHDSFTKAKQTLETLPPDSKELSVPLDHALALNNLGVVLQETGKLDDALIFYQKALELRENLARSDQKNATFRFGVAESCRNTGSLLNSLQRSQEALSVYSHGREVLNQLVTTHPTVTKYRSELASLLLNLSNLYNQMGQVDRSKESVEQSIVQWSRLVELNPAVTRFQIGLANGYSYAGAIDHRQGQFANAITYFEKGRSILERVGKADPQLLTEKSELGTVCFNLGLLHEEMGSGTQANENYQAALRIQRELSESYPDNMEYSLALANTYSSIGNQLYTAHRNVEALEALQRGREILERLTQAYPKHDELLAGHASCLHSIGGMQEDATAGVPVALTYYQQAADLWRQLVGRRPQQTHALGSLAAVLNDCARLEIGGGNYAEATTHLQEAIQLQKRALAIEPQNFQIRKFLRIHYFNLGRIAGETANLSIQTEFRAGITELAASDSSFNALDQRLVAVESGAPVLNSQEQLKLANRALDLGRCALATRWFEEAFKADPSLADDRPSPS